MRAREIGGEKKKKGENEKVERAREIGGKNGGERGGWKRGEG